MNEEQRITCSFIVVMLQLVLIVIFYVWSILGYAQVCEELMILLIRNSHWRRKRRVKGNPVVLVLVCREEAE